MKKILALTMMILVFSGLLSCTPANTNKPLEKVVVQAGWILNGEYAPECSALVNGYYKEEGLDVELRPGGPSGSSFLVSTLILAQDPEVDIAISGDVVELIRGRAKSEKPEGQLRVKMFASLWQENPLGFIVRGDSGLNSLKDLAKLKPDGTEYIIGAPAGFSDVFLPALASYIGVDLKDLKIVQTGFDASPFLAGQVDALIAFWTTQAYEVEAANIPYRFLSMSEIPGFSQPSHVIMAREETLQQKPDLLEKWLRATIKGAQYNIEHPEESGKQILDSRCGGANFDSKQETWLIQKSRTLYEINGSLNKIGYMNKDQIMGYMNIYWEYKQIPRLLVDKEIMDFSILDRLYGK